MNKYKWLTKRLISGALAGILLTVTATTGLAGMVAIASYPAPDVEWEATYGGTSYDRGHAVQQTADGGYIITGDTASSGPGGYNCYLIKTDSSGSTEWEKAFGGSDTDSGKSVRQTTDGGYIIAGDTVSYGAGSADFYLVKTDTFGNELWYKTFGGGNYDKAYSVQQTTDGGYIVAGYTGSFGAGAYDCYLIKTDDSGNELWSKTFGGSIPDQAYCVQQATDGGYIVAGYVSSFGAGAKDYYLIKTDDSGNELWHKTFGGMYDDEAHSVQQTTDGGYIIAGHTSSFGAGALDCYLVKTDASGNMEWEKTFGGSNYEWANSVQQTTDGGYIIIGRTGPPTGSGGDIYLVKTDNLGNMEWEKTIGGTEEDNARYGRQTTDGGYIIVGETWYSGPGLEDVYLVKVGPGVTPVPPVADAGGPYQVQVDYELTLDGSASYDPDGTIVSYDWDFGDSTTGSGAIVPHTYTTVDVYEVTLTVTDNDGIQSSDTTTVEVTPPPVPPVADAGGPYLSEVNCSVDLDGSASYHPDGTIVSYNWDFGDNTGGTGIIVPHAYTASGIYDVILTVTDSAGLESSNTTMAVVYEPTGGFATGGGWIWSVPGNFKGDPESEGKATFGFIAKYKQHAADGNLEFNYHVGDIKLKSDEITWLVISSTSAQFQGEGTINGEGLYTFRVQAKDMDYDPNKTDEFTIKIWEGTDTEGDPIYQTLNTPLGGGNIVVHNK